ncbi:MAG: nickel pincer cofactor biosynthesis protein LarB [bacterium]
MDRDRLERILSDLSRGKTTIKQAIADLGSFYENLQFASLDVTRSIRTGVDEALLCEGKSIDQIKKVALAMYRRTGRLLATRVSEEAYQAIKEVVPCAIYHERGRLVTFGKSKRKTRKRIAVVSAGAADMDVAEEAAITAEYLGNPVDRVYDVGVAGIHRLLGRIDILTTANVIIVVAGMEGALPSVVAGLVGGPVIAVPTGVGYGICRGGIPALLSMLSSCVPGVLVVNIDNGFGAGVSASLINQRRS